MLHPERFEKSAEVMMFTEQEDRYAIYQIDEAAKGRELMFMSMDYLKDKGIGVDAENYKCVYSGTLMDGNTPDELYSVFNLKPPADFKAHSMSVSDVIIMNHSGNIQAYFVDDFGFAELSDFAVQRQNILGITPESEEKDLLEDSSCITFYAAECSEFPVLGEVHRDLSLADALEAYEKIPSDRMNGIKSVGFNLQEGSDYDGMMDLLVGNRVQREFLDSIPFFKENKRVQTALERVEKYMEERHPDVDKSAKKEQKEQNMEIKKTKSQKRKEDLSL